MHTTWYTHTVRIGLWLWALAIMGLMAGPGQAAPPVKKGHDELTPAWNQVLPASTRFELEMGGEAVLDKETGLVWEQSPEAGRPDWFGARFECLARTVGDRFGWRLPSLHELHSLLDPNNPVGNPDLPLDHPFVGVFSSGYWSATEVVDFPLEAWTVLFSSSGIGNDTKTSSNVFRVWCVRGGHNHGGKY